MKVPFFDWQRLYAEKRESYLAAIDTVLSKGGFILQEDVDRFEANLRRLTGARHAIALSDATNSMLLGLRALNLQPGYEAILPSHAFVAAAQAVHFSGGVAVPVELGLDHLIDPDAVERAITPRTRVLMPVHVNGRVSNMDRLQEIASAHGLVVVEDAAQALGASLRGRQAGTFGAWGCFSFYPSKVLGTFGDAGALVTDDDNLAHQVRLMRNHGANEAKVIEASNAVWATNCRMDNLQAAILNLKMGTFHADVARRRRIAEIYQKSLAPISEIALPPGPHADQDRFDVFQNYEIVAQRRDQLKEWLRGRGVGTIVQWGGLGLHQLSGLGFTQTLPKTERFFRESLLLPMNHMLTDDEVGYVIESVQGFYRTA
jgi:dTDP-4-amino-4,6-dideoxygalactose transaminase